MLVDAHVHCFVFEEFPPGERWAFANKWAWGIRNISVDKHVVALPPVNQRGPWRDPQEVFPRVGRKVCDPDGEKLMQYMDNVGLDKVVAMMVDWGVAWAEEAEFDIEQVNKHAGELTQKYEGRFYACAGVDPRRRTARDIAERALRDYGAVGIKLMAANGFSPEDPICYPIYELAQAYEAPIVIHTGVGDVASFVQYAHPWLVEKPAKMFPRVQFVLAHAGGGLDGLWREVNLMVSCLPNIAVDLAEWQYSIPATADAPGREQEFIHVLHALRRRLGAHNIMLATDFMPGHNEKNDAFFVDLHVSNSMCKSIDISSEQSLSIVEAEDMGGRSKTMLMRFIDHCLVQFRCKFVVLAVSIVDPDLD